MGRQAEAAEKLHKAVLIEAGNPSSAILYINLTCWPPHTTELLLSPSSLLPGNDGWYLTYNCLFSVQVSSVEFGGTESLVSFSALPQSCPTCLA